MSKENAEMLTMEDSRWLSKTWDNVVAKMEEVSVRSYNKLPYTTINGEHNDLKETSVTFWTNGFFPTN